MGDVGFLLVQFVLTILKPPQSTPLTPQKGTRTKRCCSGHTSMDTTFAFLKGSSSKALDSGRSIVVSLAEGARLNKQACTSADK